MIDMDTYKNAEALEVVTGSATYDSESWLYKTGILPLVARALLNVFRFQVWKLVFAGILTVSKIGIANRDKIASMLARDDYHGALSLIMQDRDVKSSMTNTHPVYDSEYAWEMQSRFQINLKKLFWFYTYDHNEFLIMRDIVWKDGKPFELPGSTVWGLDQEDFCGKLGGVVPDRGMLEWAVKKIHIKSYDGELAEGDDEDGPFRCIIPIDMFNELEAGDEE